MENASKKFQQGLQEPLLCQIGKTSYQSNTSGYVEKTFILDEYQLINKPEKHKAVNQLAYVKTTPFLSAIHCF